MYLKYTLWHSNSISGFILELYLWKVYKNLLILAISSKEKWVAAGKEVNEINFFLLYMFCLLSFIHMHIYALPIQNQKPLNQKMILLFISFLVKQEICDVQFQFCVLFSFSLWSLIYIFFRSGFMVFKYPTNFTKGSFGHCHFCFVLFIVNFEFS